MHLHRFTIREGTRGVRWFATLYDHPKGQEGNDILETRVEAYIASGARHTGIGLAGDDDSGGLKLTAGIAHIASVWVTIGGPPIRRFLAARWPDLTERNIATLTAHDRAIWWEVWHDKWSWTRGTPRWRSGNFQWFDWIAGKPAKSKTSTEPVEVDVPMPEGNYRATIVLETVTWRRPRWPWPVIHHGYDIDILSRPGPDGPYLPEDGPDGKRPDGYIPIPGKGENAWDCGGDGTFAASGPGRTIEDAIGQTVRMALADRARRGAPHNYAEPIT